MKEFVLTQPYGNLEEMLNSGEVAVYKEELQQGNIEKYAIVSRIGNRYDLNGNKIENYAINPYCGSAEVKEMIKYTEIEALIDKEVEKAVANEKALHEEAVATLEEKHKTEIEELKQQYANNLAEVKNEIRTVVKAEILAKLNS